MSMLMEQISYSINVVLGQRRDTSFGLRPHNRVLLVRMTQAQGVAYFVHGVVKQPLGPIPHASILCEILIIVKMNSSISWRERMAKHATFSVEHSRAKWLEWGSRMSCFAKANENAKSKMEWIVRDMKCSCVNVTTMKSSDQKQDNVLFMPVYGSLYIDAVSMKWRRVEIF